ncbi:DNA-binding XRE family transcriptional regulator [Streptomyces sp. 846.5]|nr:helix-turn-helix transcriptional regulator [Streptomyces sp. 846.5]TDU05563.1 DNA-binding XRE family transcriptional regulator [Streptomyces sp. 846.5]
MKASLEQLGQRLRELRSLHQLTQQELADAAGVSKSLVSKVEAGQRPGSLDLAMAVARTLEVDLLVLLGEVEATPVVAAGRGAAYLPELRELASVYDCPPDLGRPPRSLSELAQEVARAGQLRLACQYGALGKMLIPLVEELSVAAETERGSERELAFWLLSSGYRCADAIAHKLGHLDLSTILIDRVRWAAERSGDELMLATAAYVRSEAFFVAGPVDSGLRLLAAAGEPIARRAWSDPKAASVYGALHSRAAVLAAFGHKTEQAWAHLEVAQAMAGVVGADVAYFHTSFGPASVKVHEVAIAVELGDADEAVGRARGWEPPSHLPAERASHYFIDLARAQTWLGDYGGALTSLLEARRRAPQHTRSHPGAREAATAIVHRSRRSSDAARGLATWLGIAV